MHNPAAGSRKSFAAVFFYFSQGTDRVKNVKHSSYNINRVASLSLPYNEVRQENSPENFISFERFCLDLALPCTRVAVGVGTGCHVGRPALPVANYILRSTYSKGQFGGQRFGAAAVTVQVQCPKTSLLRYYERSDFARTSHGPPNVLNEI